MQIKTSELTGAALDWAVALIEEPEMARYYEEQDLLPMPENYAYSTDWSQGGPLIERYSVGLGKSVFCWLASVDASDVDSGAPVAGPTPLIAAMRAIVAAELGDTVDVPEELAP